MSEFKWVGTVSGNPCDPRNYEPSGLPGPDDDVIVPDGSVINWGCLLKPIRSITIIPAPDGQPGKTKIGGPRGNARLSGVVTTCKSTGDGCVDGCRR